MFNGNPRRCLASVAPTVPIAFATAAAPTPAYEQGAVRALVSTAFDKASGILTRQREPFERGAQQLLHMVTLGEEVLIKPRPRAPADAKQA